jgi:hypothetical protein
VSILRDPKPDSSLTPFHEGLAVLKHHGEIVGHIATSVGKFWSPFSPLSHQWWVWSVIVWADGTKERAIEDYPPWSYVKEMQKGKLNWDKKSFDVKWLSASEANRMIKELNINSEDF